MLTLEQIAEGRRLMAADSDGGACASDCLEVWFRVHAEALLDAAERVARDEAWQESLVVDDRAFATAQMEDDAAFARNELAAGERLAREARASVRLDDEPPGKK